MAEETLPLRELIDERDRRYQERWEAQQAALTKALTSMEARLVTLNELRGVVTDAQGTFLTRNEFDAKHQVLNDRVDALAKQVYIVVGATGLLITILHFAGAWK
jgi:hypothetical protein